MKSSLGTLCSNTLWWFNPTAARSLTPQWHGGKNWQGKRAKTHDLRYSSTGKAKTVHVNKAKQKINSLLPISR